MGSCCGQAGSHEEDPFFGRADSEDPKILREADEGPVAEVAKKHGVGDVTIVDHGFYELVLIVVRYTHCLISS